MKMRFLVIVGLIVVAMVGQAVAADLPSSMADKDKAITAPYNWTGFYFGLNMGYGFGGDNSANFRPVSASFSGVFAANDVATPIGAEPAGVLGGAQIGYNYQICQWMLVGLETDLQATDMHDSGFGSTRGAGGFLPEQSKIDQSLSWLGTVRGRIGVLPMDRLLMYGTGGLAYGETDLSASIAFPLLTQLYAGSKSFNDVGWTVGGGLEYSFMKNWSVKTEYLFYNLGSDTINITTVTGAPGTAFATFDNTGHVVRIGVNYKFF